MILMSGSFVVIDMMFWTKFKTSLFVLLLMTKTITATVAVEKSLNLEEEMAHYAVQSNVMAIMA